MSTLPDIDYQAVAKKLGHQLGEKSLHLAVVEALAESLRDQRDAALKDAETLRSENGTLHEKCNALTSELDEERATETAPETAYSFGDPDNTKP